MLPQVKKTVADETSLRQCLLRSLGVNGALGALSALGLSKGSNSDKPLTAGTVKKRYGLNGLTSSGARKLRNGAYLMQKYSNKKYLTFATVTLPSDLTDEQAGMIHSGWSDVMEAYQREIKRELERSGLKGELIGCSEIQVERFEETGKPWLHAHYVWVGRTRRTGWSITTQKHDEIFHRALNVVVQVDFEVCKSCCNLQPVRKDCSQYLSKYMSKGSSVIDSAVALGYDWWMPKQWYFMTRSVLSAIKKETKQGKSIATNLECLRYAEPTFFRYWKDIFMPTSDPNDIGIWVGCCGSLVGHSASKLVSVVS